MGSAIEIKLQPLLNHIRFGEVLLRIQGAERDEVALWGGRKMIGNIQPSAVHTRVLKINKPTLLPLPDGHHHIARQEVVVAKHGLIQGLLGSSVGGISAFAVGALQKPGAPVVFQRREPRLEPEQFPLHLIQIQLFQPLALSGVVEPDTECRDKPFIQLVPELDLHARLGSARHECVHGGQLPGDTGHVDVAEHLLGVKASHAFEKLFNTAVCECPQEFGGQLLLSQLREN
mmetsp:Transcript_56321/g.149951  ORF Transcript_56321/g.149951 Transcript_56321/m.149951 type:complete len:231 (-) Transcript_56321:315-1007(-)